MECSFRTWLFKRGGASSQISLIPYFFKFNSIWFSLNLCWKPNLAVALASCFIESFHFIIKMIIATPKTESFRAVWLLFLLLYLKGSHTYLVVLIFVYKNHNNLDSILHHEHYSYRFYHPVWIKIPTEIFFLILPKLYFDFVMYILYYHP